MLQGVAPAPAFSSAWGQPQPPSTAATPDGAPYEDAGINMTLALHRHHARIYEAWRLKVHHVLQGVAPAPAFSPAWGQPQPQPPSAAAAAPDSAPYEDAGINMTLALTGVSATTLAPATRQAITNAVAQQVSSVGERPSQQSSAPDAAFALREPRLRLATEHLFLARCLCNPPQSMCAQACRVIKKDL